VVLQFLVAVANLSTREPRRISACNGSTKHAWKVMSLTAPGAVRKLGQQFSEQHLLAPIRIPSRAGVPVLVVAGSVPVVEDIRCHAHLRGRPACDAEWGSACALACGSSRIVRHSDEACRALRVVGPRGNTRWSRLQRVVGRRSSSARPKMQSRSPE